MDGILQTMYNLTASIGTSLTESAWSYALLDAGLENMAEAQNEVVNQYQFFSGKGFASNHVTGMAPAFTLTGKRVMGDAAQDYIMGLKYETGKDRQSSFKLEWADGAATPVEHTLTVPCTICNIQEWGGAALDDAGISIEIRFDAKPTLT